VTKADQDHGHIALAVAVAFGHLHQALDLELDQVLAVAAHVPVVWRRSVTVRNSEFGATSRRFVLAMISALPKSRLGVITDFDSRT
jgi:hypothetical protein